MRQQQPESPVGTSHAQPPPLLTLATLLQLCRETYSLERYSALHEYKYLLLHFPDESCALDEADTLPIVQRLRALPCPVIAIGDNIPLALQRGVDVMVPALADATGMIRNIEAWPLAAMTLVQLLRHNEDISPSDGLLAESLAYATLQGGAEFAREQLSGSVPVPDTVETESHPAVKVERIGAQLHIVLNRPNARNAYCAAMRDGFYEALQLLQADESLCGAVVSGEGDCFCIGGDLNEFGRVSDIATAHAIRSSRNVGRLLLTLHARLEFRLHRACIGAGIELPAFADRVVADRCTFVQLPEITLGLLPGAGGTVSIPLRIGRHRTAYMALSARKIKARTALEWGLIDALV